MEQKRIHRLKVAALIFKGTSDDLFFWVLIDTLFLTQVKGFSVTEVSLRLYHLVLGVAPVQALWL